MKPSISSTLTTTQTSIKTMPPKADWEKYTAPVEEDETKPEEKIVPLSEGDIQVLRTYVSTTGGD